MHRKSVLSPSRDSSTVHDEFDHESRERKHNPGGGYPAETDVRQKKRVCNEFRNEIHRQITVLSLLLAGLSQLGIHGFEIFTLNVVYSGPFSCKSFVEERNKWASLAKDESLFHSWHFV